MAGAAGEEADPAAGGAAAAAVMGAADGLEAGLRNTGLDGVGLVGGSAGNKVSDLATWG